MREAGMISISAADLTGMSAGLMSVAVTYAETSSSAAETS